MDAALHGCVRGKLAPHGKTTMAPRLFEMQLKGGAWGITLATAHQVMVAHAHGVRRVLMANQLVGKQNMRIIADLLAIRSLSFIAWWIRRRVWISLGEFFSRSRTAVECAAGTGRAWAAAAGFAMMRSCRQVLDALTRWSEVVQLCGVELYEGVLKDEESIRAFLRRACEVTQKLLDAEAICAAAGAAFWRGIGVVRRGGGGVFRGGFGDAVEIVLRPGCYLTHDVGNYETQQKRILESNPIAREMRSGLVPALHIWAYVQSIPEPELAVVAMGRRDAAFDSGLPTPALHFGREAESRRRLPRIGKPRR